MSSSAPSGRPPLPSWFAAGLLSLLVATAAFEVVGATLLAVDRYSPVVTGVVALGAATVAAVALAARDRRRSTPVRVGIAPVLLALGVAVAFGAFNAAHHAEHLLADRDPGVYVISARSIARTHELQPDAREGPFDNRQVGVASVGFAEPYNDGRLQPNFFTGLPVLLAGGHALGGDTGLLLVPVALGALAVLTMFALASHVVGPWLAVFAAAVLAISPVQTWLSRDAYSELAVEVAALGGLWIYLEARGRRWTALAVVAGAVYASGTFARIDTAMLLVGLPVLVVVEWWFGRDDDSVPRPLPVRGALAFAGTGIAVGLYGYVASWHLSYGYLHYHLDRVTRLAALCVAAGVVSVGLVVALRRKVPSPAARRRIAVVVAVLVAGAGVALWLVRPVLAGDPPRFPGYGPGRPLPADLRTERNHYWGTHSLRWLDWYHGVPAVAAAIAAVAVLVAATITRACRRLQPAALVAVTAAAPTVVYAWQPKISADQMWAVRRFLPLTVPALVLMAVLTGALLLVAADRARRPATRLATRLAATVVLVAVAVAPLLATLDIADARQGRGALATVEEVCGAVGDDSAVIVLRGGLVDGVLPASIRAFCGVPTASTGAGRGSSWFDDRAEGWSKRGRDLYLVADDEAAIARAAPGAEVVLRTAIVDDADLERVVDRRPSGRRSTTTEIVVARWRAAPDE